MARFLPSNGLRGRICQKWPVSHPVMVYVAEYARNGPFPYPVMVYVAECALKWPICLCKWPQECDVSASGAQDEWPNWQPGSWCCCWLSRWGRQEKMGHIAFYVQRKSSYKQQGVCRTVKLPFTLKSILRQKKNYGHSNISPCKNRIFKKIF